MVLRNSMTPELLREDHGKVCVLTLNRPGARNALSDSLLASLQAAFTNIKDDPAIHVVVLNANGPGFCAGHDLKEVLGKEDALFGTPGVNIGLWCSTPMVAVSRAVNQKAAMEMLLTGDMIDAESAVRHGLVNRVVPHDALMEETMALAERIASKSRLVVGLGKQAFYKQGEMDLDDAYAYASKVMTHNMLKADAAEGIGAFVEKRQPIWSNS
jgi:enoyl-CoA hydratase/carnithine racemase